MSELDELRLVLYPPSPFRERVWVLRHNLSAYDALYLALAEALTDSVLITGDAGLASNARRILATDAYAISVSPQR